MFNCGALQVEIALTTITSLMEEIKNSLEKVCKVSENKCREIENAQHINYLFCLGNEMLPSEDFC